MTETFKLVGIDSGKVYMESLNRASLQRWLASEFGKTDSGVRKNVLIRSMPEAMKIVKGRRIVEGDWNELLNYGFVYNPSLKGALLPLSEIEGVIFMHLLIRLDQLNEVEIYKIILREGLRRVSEKWLLNNEAEAYSGAKKKYLAFKERFPVIQSVE